MRPSPSEFSLRPHVALLVETSLASGRDILRGVARWVREHQPWALYIEPRSLESALPHWLDGWEGQGIIARVQSRAMAQQLRATGLPVVDVLGEVGETGFPLVHVDDGALADLAAEHLLALGFRHFGFVGLRGLNWSEARRDRFRERLVQEGLGLEVHDVEGHQPAWERVADDLAQWVTRLAKPCGVLLGSDQLGPTFFEACRRAGAVSPGEVGVLGVDDDQALCEVCDPPLSSLRAGHEGVGYAAASLLEGLLRGQTAPREPRRIAPEGITSRLSTGLRAVADRQVAQALGLIRQAAHLGLDVDTLARSVALSRSVLQRRFRQHLGTTIHTAILEARLQRACTLLQETDLSLVEVAERSGFTHQEYLGHVFRTRLNTTPAKYRDIKR